MVERKDVCSSSPERTPKLQLTAGQPSDRRMLDPTKKEKHTLHPRAKKKTQQDSRRGKTDSNPMPPMPPMHLDSNPMPTRDSQMAPVEAQVSSGLLQG